MKPRIADSSALGPPALGCEDVGDQRLVLRRFRFQTCHHLSCFVQRVLTVVCVAQRVKMSRPFHTVSQCRQVRSSIAVRSDATCERSPYHNGPWYPIRQRNLRRRLSSWRRRLGRNVSITPGFQLGSVDKTVTSGPNARASISYASGINTENLSDSVASSPRDETQKKTPRAGLESVAGPSCTLPPKGCVRIAGTSGRVSLPLLRRGRSQNDMKSEPLVVCTAVKKVPLGGKR
jgi:hypothetical protein